MADRYRVITFLQGESPVIKGDRIKSLDSALIDGRREARKHSLSRGSCFTSVQRFIASARSWDEVVTVYGKQGAITDELMVEEQTS